MSKKSLADISKVMRDIDIAILSTRTPDGGIAGRPMSNNRDVDYDGESYFFTLDKTTAFTNIKRDPKVNLSYQGPKSLLGKPGMIIVADGSAEVITGNKELFKAHWTKDLDVWFEKGVDTPGLALIKVRAGHITYWDGQEEGEIKVK